MGYHAGKPIESAVFCLTNPEFSATHISVRERHSVAAAIIVLMVIQCNHRLVGGGWGLPMEMTGMLV